ncbi:AAA family ATPase [Flammeovirga pacifica]|uniref:VWFA domain-containing protein n=1 Tax=Flammeovirga pacifica TaxID=915059 RepID=A0A1S1YXX7_FLAPC|nr:AAA family ATPase [Flammeovirga pacifica]OHX65862.1 hypothetical protein NH26_05600 [Flammeovirga pacifica]
MLFPFTAIVGQEEFKLALLLNCIDPSLGGVLAIGDKGTGKTTLIRSLSQLLERPFVNLPIGASEDRVMGHLNLEKLINDKQEHLKEGLLGKANQGFLYVDEINLLNDYLMDILLDASASGFYFLEREGLSQKVTSQFSFIGSMNPEEGELRPQLKDRFGLSVHIKTINDVEDRVQVIKRRLRFDESPKEFYAQYQEEEIQLYNKVQYAIGELNQIQLSDEVFTYCSQLAIDEGVEGLRADILLFKTARAYAAYHDLKIVTVKEVKAIQHLVLSHRSNKSNQTPPPPDQQQKEKEKKQQEKSEEQPFFQPIIPQNEVKFNSIFSSGSQQNVVVGKEKNTIDQRKTVGQYIAKDQFELHYKNQVESSKKHIIFIIDASGSMYKEKMVAYAKGVVQKMGEKESNIHTSYSLISLVNNEAKVILTSNDNFSLVVNHLQELESGGKTNVIESFKKVNNILLSNHSDEANLVLISDGHFCAEHTFSDIVSTYQYYCKKVNQLILFDTEFGVVQLGIMQQLSKTLNAKYEKLIP